MRLVVGLGGTALLRSRAELNGAQKEIRGSEQKRL